jgi:hypothetical protein
LLLREESITEGVCIILQKLSSQRYTFNSHAVMVSTEPFFRNSKLFEIVNTELHTLLRETQNQFIIMNIKSIMQRVATLKSV